MAKRKPRPCSADRAAAIALPSDLSPSLARAIDRHKAPLKATKEASEAPSRSSDEDFDAAVSAEIPLLHKLAKARCANDDEFFAKIAYILAVDCDQWGRPEIYWDYGCPLTLAIEEHLKHRRRAETEGRAA